MSKIDDLSDKTVTDLIGELIKRIDINDEYSNSSERITINNNNYKLIVSNDEKGLTIKLIEKL